jgi:RsiW-degrading membrane proteinase PrsW (M82 family)
MATLRAQAARWSPPFHSLTALLCGALWWLIFARIAGVPPRRWAPPLAGFLLGVLSTTLTLGAGILFPVRFDEHGDFGQRALFYILGVGLREETFKLACALPLIAWLRREPSANVVLVSLCAVGIGFAVEENTGYFDGGTSPAWTRFLTANFLHLAWTGMLGFSLWRALRGAVRGWEDFAATFLLVVLTHGAYNLCFGDLLNENLALISIVILIAVAFRFFALLRSVAELSRQIVSPLAVFLLGSVALLGLAFVALCGTLGLRPGGAIVIGQALAAAPMAFLFLREFRDD